MEVLFNDIVLEHKTGMHPESPKRLEVFHDLHSSEKYDGTPFLNLVHHEKYIEKVKALCLAGGGEMELSTVVSPRSFEAASYAVGATVAASEQEGFALVRPPGHHAHASHGGGFCLFNNVAIAAERLARQGKRVLIFDFDGHYGDGTAALFYPTDKVLYWSIHQFPAFPGQGSVDELGEGPGEGFNLNVPLPPGSGDDIFKDAFEHYLPIAQQFNPDVVAVSAGFDGHQYDLLLHLKYSTGLYFHLGNWLAEAFPRLFATLEGGYNVSELPKCVFSFLAGVNDLPNPYPGEPTQSGLRAWETYEMYLHGGLGKLKPYWSI